ncbi:P-loop containing nucleoside triphosphate hydrolase protein [Aspergillus cavernicola]|uniref:P-loop containing nucleoside triphosphate hydrolase protein n=1 Tax=Aspergillus cavernicola TaxID=176166 RepID=A0ABR4HU71_9EURO
MKPYRNPNYIPPDPTSILLHGGPGVGKTTTARYLAEHTRRPLLSISSAAIIKNDGEAEGTFKQILNQAIQWKAIVLLENVELIFSENSNRRDPNAILFITALETHRGLMFLTTDRIGMMDSSLISRISIPLEIPPLCDAAKMMILTNHVEDHAWELGGEALRVEEHWHELDAERLNGSDIHNAFNTALKMTMAAGPWWDCLKMSLQLQIERQKCLQEVRGDEANLAFSSRWRRN